MARITRDYRSIDEDVSPSLEAHVAEVTSGPSLLLTLTSISADDETHSESESVPMLPTLHLDRGLDISLTT